jgi:hypothetical protein
MAWDYDPKEAVQVLPEGEYDGELTTVEEKVSAKGNPMLVLTWAVTMPDRVHRILEYVVRPSGIWKYKMIAVALGEERAFDHNTFDIHQHVGKFCRLAVGIQKQDNYPEKNVIGQYDAASFDPGNEPIPVAGREAAFDASGNSDIPF